MVRDEKKYVRYGNKFNGANEKVPQRREINKTFLTHLARHMSEITYHMYENYMIF